MSLLIRDVEAADADSICSIYNHYVLHETATFEEQPLAEKMMLQNIKVLQSLHMPWLVAVNDQGALVAYAYANLWRPRGAYRFSAESTIYVKHDCTGDGAGRQLYTALLDRLAASKVHTVLGVLTLPNEASVALHEKLGFNQVAHLREVGYKFGRWLDVGYRQKMLRA